jgi:hypothetical protein
MTNAKSEFRVQVVDDEIVVTWPGSIYSVTYLRRYFSEVDIYQQHPQAERD